MLRPPSTRIVGPTRIEGRRESSSIFSKLLVQLLILGVLVRTLSPASSLAGNGLRRAIVGSHHCVQVVFLVAFVYQLLFSRPGFRCTKSLHLVGFFLHIKSHRSTKGQHNFDLWDFQLLGKRTRIRSSTISHPPTHFTTHNDTSFRFILREEPPGEERPDPGYAKRKPRRMPQLQQQP